MLSFVCLACLEAFCGYLGSQGMVLLDGMSAINQTSSLNKSDRSNNATDDPMGGAGHPKDEPMGDGCPTSALDHEMEIQYAYLKLTCHD